MELVKRAHYHNLIRFGEANPKVVVLSADLTASCEADGFRDTFPERFFSLGLAEQNMMGFAAGMAREGYSPYVHTFAVFITRRPFDQVAMSIAYANLKVRLIGFLPGVTTPGGVTHQAIDDVGLMRLIPNMTIIDCGDATEVESALDVAEAVDGPVYVRMLRGEVPRLFPADEKLVLGQVRTLCEGDDLLIVSSGISTEEAIRGVGVLEALGVRVTHLHVNTLKPFDPTPVLEAARHVRAGVITMENHSVIGGLGALVAESMAEAGLGKKLRRIGIQDRYAHGAGKRYLMREMDIDAHALLRIAEDLLQTAVSVTPEALALNAEAPASADPAAAPIDKVEDL